MRGERRFDVELVRSGEEVGRGEGGEAGGGDGGGSEGVEEIGGRRGEGTHQSDVEGN